MSTQPERHIVQVQFSTFSDQERQNKSVRTITDKVVFTPAREPRDNGPNSLFLGSTSRSVYCKTCHNTTKHCPGHFGLIKFPVPLYNPFWFEKKNNMVFKILSAVCFFCSHPVVPFKGTAAHLQQPNGPTTKKKSKALLERKCTHCGAQQPLYKIWKNQIQTHWTTKFNDPTVQALTEEPFTSVICDEIFRAIPPNVWRAAPINLKKPPHEVCLQSSMLLPSPKLRPGFRLKDGKRGDDSLTKQASKIITECAVVKTALRNQPPNRQAKTISRLQSEFNAFVYQATTTSNKGTKVQSLASRLKGKSGLIRQNILGKRFNNCARGVLGCDPTLDVDEILVPRHMALILTVPYRCTSWNRDECLALIRKGANTLGGAEYIERANGVRVSLQNLTPETLRKVENGLRDGDVIHRYIRDGDYVVLNRAPTLRIYSFMTVRVKIDHNPNHCTIRINQMLMTPYNGDCDGDEVTLHPLQTDQARAEAATIMNVAENTINIANNSSIFCPVQDTASALFITTHRRESLPTTEIGQIMMHARFVSVARQQQLNELLRTTTTLPLYWLFTLLLPRDFHCEPFYRRGDFIAPNPLTKKHCSTILLRLTLDYGHQQHLRTLSDLSRVMQCFLGEYWGLSTGLQDLVVSPQFQPTLTSGIEPLLAEAAADQTERNRAATLSRIAGVVEECRAQWSDAGRNPFNGLRVMVDSGAKGKRVNFDQLMANVGSQMINNQLPTEDPNGRCLKSIVEPHSQRPEAHGYIVSSYLEGLTPTESFFHQSAGRDGLIDTSVKTATTGYGQRKAQKTCEDAITKFGEEGQLWLMMRNVILSEQCLDGFGPGGLRPWRTNLWTPRPHPSTEAWRKIVQSGRQLPPSFLAAQTEETVYIPFHLGEFIDQHSSDEAVPWETFLQPLSKILSHFRYGCRALQIFHLWDELTTRRVLPVSVPVVCRALERALARCQLDAGTALGNLAASFFSHDSTQQTLSSFHQTGASLKTASGAISHILESKKDCVFNVTVPLRSTCINHSREALTQFAQSLVGTTLQELVHSYEISQSYTPFPLDPGITEPWHLMLKLKRKVLLGRHLSLLTICQNLRAQITLPVTASPFFRDGRQPWIVIHFPASTTVEREPLAIATTWLKRIRSISVHGLPHVRYAGVKPGVGQQFCLECQTTSLEPFLRRPDIFDLSSLVCDNPLAVSEWFGIESALVTMMAALARTEINLHWVYVMSVILCSTGRPVAGNSHGMKKTFHANILSTAAFEQCKNVMVKAATAEKQCSTTNSVTAATMVCTTPGFGTGSVTVIDTTAQQVAAPTHSGSNRISTHLTDSLYFANLSKPIDTKPFFAFATNFYQQQLLRTTLVQQELNVRQRTAATPVRTKKTRRKKLPFAPPLFSGTFELHPTTYYNHEFLAPNPTTDTRHPRSKRKSLF